MNDRFEARVDDCLYEFVERLSEEFGIFIPWDEAERVIPRTDLIAYLRSRVAQKERQA